MNLFIQYNFKIEIPITDFKSSKWTCFRKDVKHNKTHWIEWLSASNWEHNKSNVGCRYVEEISFL